MQRDIIKNQHLRPPSAALIFDDGEILWGHGLGAIKSVIAELCFNTSMYGYQEVISDPSYADQIILFTFPHIGNVGTNKEDHESDKIWTKGVIFNSNITNHSNYRSLANLDLWLKKNSQKSSLSLDNFTSFRSQGPRKN